MNQKDYEHLAGINRTEKELSSLCGLVSGYICANEDKIKDYEENYRNKYPEITKLKCINVGYNQIKNEIGNILQDLCLEKKSILGF